MDQRIGSAVDGGENLPPLARIKVGTPTTTERIIRALNIRFDRLLTGEESIEHPHFTPLPQTSQQLSLKYFLHTQFYSLSVWHGKKETMQEKLEKRLDTRAAHSGQRDQNKTLS
jgi:hypothetical protein